MTATGVCSSDTAPLSRSREVSVAVEEEEQDEAACATRRSGEAVAEEVLTAVPRDLSLTLPIGDDWNFRRICGDGGRANSGNGAEGGASSSPPLSIISS